MPRVTKKTPPLSSSTRLANRQAIHILLIVVIGFLAYSNSFYSPFQWDEEYYILENPIVRDLGFFAEPSRAAELPFYDGLKSRYIGYLTFALNYKLHGFNVFGYHVVNLVIHLLNAIVVYFLVLLTFRTPFFSGQHSAVSTQQSENTPPPFAKGEKSGFEAFDDSLFTIHYSRIFALAVSLLFVSHPIQTEAVTYVFQRFASLASLFYLASLVFYIKGRLASEQTNKLTGYLLSLLCTIAAMKTKENSFTLPLIIMLYEFLFFSGPVKKRALRLAPFLLTMLIIPLTITGVGRPAGEIMSEISDPAGMGFMGVSRSDYILTQPRVIITYIRLLFMPVNQSLFHDYPVYRSFFDPPVLFSLLVLSALFGLAIYLVYRSRQVAATGSKKSAASSDQTEAEGGRSDNDSPFTFQISRLFAFGILWFFITLSVESSIIAIAMVIDEYRVYLPSVGFFIALMSGVLLLLRQSSRFIRLGGPTWEVRFTKAAVAAFVVIVLILASATYARNSVWKDKISMWEDVVSKSPNFPLGYINLGLAYYEKKLYNEAIAMHARAVALLPVYLDAYINLGTAYSAAGKTDLAIKTYQTALAMYPNNSTLYFNLAHAYAAGGMPEKAVENFLISIQFDPYNANAYHGLGTMYARLGRLEDALEAYSKFVMLSPDNPEAYLNRGIVYDAKGDLYKARADIEKSCSLGSKESCEYLQEYR